MQDWQVVLIVVAPFAIVVGWHVGGEIFKWWNK